MRTGFTLIELLVVVALISILAAIGMSNYSGTVTRTRVSRVRSDFMAIRTAIESYRIDHNSLPRMAHRRFYNDSDYDFFLGEPINGTLSKVLSTPIAYLTSATYFDPFLATNSTARLDERLYTYHVLPEYVKRENASGFWTRAIDYYGDWRLGSIGPDRSFAHGFANSAQLPYDPTNGVTSAGNIWESQKQPQSLPPVPQILGPHG